MSLIKVFLIAAIGVSLACSAGIGKDDGSPLAVRKLVERDIYISGDIDSQGGGGGDAILDGPAGDGSLDVVGGAGGEGIIILRGRVVGKVRGVGGRGGHANVRHHLPGKRKFKGRKRVVGGSGNVGLVIGDQSVGDDASQEDDDDAERRRRDLRRPEGGGRRKRNVLVGLGKDGEGYEMSRRPGGTLLRDLRRPEGGGRRKRDVFVGLGKDGEGYEVSRRPGGTLLAGANGGDGLVIEGSRRGGDQLVGKSTEAAGPPPGRVKRQTSEFYVRQFKSVKLHEAVLVQEVFGRQVGGGHVTVLARGTVRLGPDGAFVDGDVFVDARSGYGGDAQRWKVGFLIKWSRWNARRRRWRRDVGLEDEDDDDDIGIVSTGGNRRVNKRRNKKKNRQKTIEIRGGSGGKGLVIRGSVDGFIKAVGGDGGDVTLGETDDETERGEEPSGSNGRRPGGNEYFFDDGKDGTIMVNSDGSRVRISTGTERGKEPSGSNGKRPGGNEYFFDDGKDGTIMVNSDGSRVRISTGTERGKEPSGSNGRRPGGNEYFFDDGKDGTIMVNSDGSRVRISTGTERGKEPSGGDGKGPGEDESDQVDSEDDGGGKTVITEMSSKGSAGSRVRIDGKSLRRVMDSTW